MKKLTGILVIIAVITSCSDMRDVEGVQCIRTIDIAATNLSCNWEKYNIEHPPQEHKTHSQH